MKKIYTILFLICGLSTLGIAQDLVLTAPTNKIAVVEEFTGTNCPACPSGHTSVANLLSSNQNAIALAYSPNNSSLTGPYSGGADLRRSFLDQFYTNPYYNGTGGRSMPSGFINRKKSSSTSERKLSPSEFASAATAVNGESSPINLGLESLYNSSNQTLAIEVEMYFTQDVTSNLGMYVMMTENDVQANQSGASDPFNYIHQHVTREMMNTDMWGDDVTGTTTTGNYVTMNYNFDMNNAISPVVIGNAHMVAFVYDKTTEEVITAVEVDAENGTTRHTTSSIDEIGVKNMEVSLSPNPTSYVSTLRYVASGQEEVEIAVYNLLGNEVYTEINTNPNQGMNSTLINTSELNLASGSYLVRVKEGQYTAVSKLTVR